MILDLVDDFLRRRRADVGLRARAEALGDLGADIIKVEAPSGDYIREMTWPIIEGVSLMHYHLNRGKKSITLDLKNEAAREIYRELVRGADVVIEASKPGALARYGLGYEDLRKINPKIVFCTVSGYGMTGPYKDMPSHGIAYDTWCGVVKPAYDDEGFCYIPEHVGIGINAAPLFGGLVAGLFARVFGANRPIVPLDEDDDHIVILQDEDGNDVPFEHIKTLSHKGSTYILLEAQQKAEEQIMEDDSEPLVLKPLRHRLRDATSPTEGRPWQSD